MSSFEIKPGDILHNVRNGKVATVTSVKKNVDGDSHADWITTDSNIYGCRITFEDEGWYKKR